eukprot:g11283.t1 g11283   contig5:520994-523971(-)
MATTKQSYGSTATPTQNVQVIAPATLIAGYTFDAMYDGATFTVTVPDGGVVKGQRFIVPFSPPPMAVAVGVPTDGGSIESGGPGGAAPTFAAKGNRSSSEGIPTGVWRDNLCDCCKFGPCHPHFLNAWLCRPLLMGQILTRMKMTWLGQRTPTTGSINDSRTDVDELWRNTFRNLVVLTVVFYLLMSMTSTPQTMDPTMPSLSGFNATTAIDGSSGQPHIITYDEMSASDKVKYTLNGWISTLLYPINEVHGEVDHGKAMFIPFSLYLVASLFYTFLDMALSLAMWSAASLGTPTDPRGRESILRYLLYAKIIFMNMLLLLLLGSGIFLVHDGRKYNYGCGSDRESVIETFEGSACLVRDANTTAKHRTIVAMIGDCITCLQCLSCNKLGGGKIRSKVDLNDAAVAFMDFFNIDSNFDLVLSDVYITFKLLSRMHRERKFKLGQQARTDERCKRRGHENAKEEGTSDNSTMNKKVLQHTQETDMHHLRDAARYSHYALGVYDNYHDSLIANGQLIGGMGGIYYPWKTYTENHARCILQSCFRLSSYTVLVYGTLPMMSCAQPIAF